MTRQEFLNELRIALQGQVDQNTINENVKYYESYIMQESRKGVSEEEVIEQLGNPRLIAKTIMSSYEGETRDGYEYQGNTGYSGENHSTDYDSQRDIQFNGKVYTGAKAKVLVVTAILAVILVVIGIIALVAGIISILAPILIPLLLIVLAVRLISRQ